MSYASISIRHNFPEIAARLKRLPSDHARGLLPPPPISKEQGDAVLALVAANGVLTDEAASAIDRDNARKRLAEIKAMFTEPKKGAA